MDQDRAKRGLRELATTVARRSKIQQLASVLPDVEAALAAGATRSEVMQRLKDSGLPMSPATFGSALARLRKRLRPRGAPSTAAPRASQAGPDPETSPPSSAPVPANPASGALETVQDIAALRTQVHDLDALEQRHRERRRRERTAAPAPAGSSALKVPERWKPKPPPSS